jgi:hypothetical protein
VVGPSEDAIPAIQMATLGHDWAFCDVHTYFAFELRDTGFISGFGVIRIGFAFFFGNVHIFSPRNRGNLSSKFQNFPSKNKIISKDSTKISVTNQENQWPSTFLSS